MANMSIGEERKTAQEALDLTPLHEGELPIFVLFLKAIVSSDDNDNWANLIDQFGKCRILNK